MLDEAELLQLIRVFHVLYHKAREWMSAVPSPSCMRVALQCKYTNGVQEGEQQTRRDVRA
jgi:hypothetical protein